MHLICGEALYDVFVEPEAADSAAEINLSARGGGSPYNVAVGLARLGVRVALLSDIARDGLGERLAQRMAAEGISDRFLKRSAPATALAFVTLGADGVASYSFSGLHDADLGPDFKSVMANQGDITNLHLGSIALVLPRSANALLDLASRLSSHTLVSLDPNVRLAIEPNPSRWRKAIEAARSLAHVVKVSEEDLALAYGKYADPERVCKQWLSGRTVLVALTRGSAGATLLTRALEPISIAAMSVSTVDTVGAGDAFMAALLGRLTQKASLTAEAIATLEIADLQDLGQFAAAAAALTCSRRGPALPHYAEVDALAARWRTPGTVFADVLKVGSCES